MDHSNGDLPVFESGAIMMYLAERYGDGSLLPKEGKARYEVIQWLMFQMGGLGPMMGQANHFIQYAPESVPYGQKRYYNESKRLLGVLESRLKDREYLAGDQFTLADIANFCWVLYAFHAAIDVDEFPSVKVRVMARLSFLLSPVNVQEWIKRIYAREATQKGIDVPEGAFKKVPAIVS